MSQADTATTLKIPGSETWEAKLTHAQQLEKQPPCQGNCPSGIDIRGWINLIAQREKNGLSQEDAYKNAWTRLVDTNPFPSVTGRVCPHTCESDCNRHAKEGPVSIQSMERHIGDWALDKQLALPKITGDKEAKSEAESGTESIGVIGSGPAGLSFAYQMARRGYAVTIYEQHAAAGGMLRYGIPAYRLPRDILQGEIDRIIDLGVDLRLNCKIGQDLPAEQIKQAHRAVFLAIGADRPLALGIPGESHPNVVSGTQFMYRANQGHSIDLGQSAVVVGGGNTAIDAARAARRRGAQVTLLYRRTRQEMPAIAEEIDDALAEGIQIDFLATPLEIHPHAPSAMTVTVQRMKLSAADASGRAQTVPIPGDTYEIPASMLIPAVSQAPEWKNIEGMFGDAGQRPTADNRGALGDDLWAGGDILGLGTVTRAIGQGRCAAEALHAQLQNRQPSEASAKRQSLTSAAMHIRHYSDKHRLVPQHRPVDAWLSEPDQEIKLPISDAAFLNEADRCLSCGNCFGCQLCWMYCNASAFTPRQDTSPGWHFVLDHAKCEGCGKCIELCPSGFLSPLPAISPRPQL